MGNDFGKRFVCSNNSNIEGYNSYISDFCQPVQLKEQGIEKI